MYFCAVIFWRDWGNPRNLGSIGGLWIDTWTQDLPNTYQECWPLDRDSWCSQHNAVYTLILKQTAVGISYKDFFVECLVPSINSFDPNAMHFASPWQVLLNFYLTASIKFRLNAMRYMCHKPSRKYLGGCGVLGWMTFWNSFRTFGCGFVILLSGPELFFLLPIWLVILREFYLRSFLIKLVKLCVSFLWVSIL